MTKRAAVYLRVSTRDQTLANQVPDLERLLSARGFAIAATYQDEESGVKRRPGLDRLMVDAAHHRFDVVVVWALDRLGRSMGDVVANVLELERIGVDLLSAREPWLDTMGPVRSLLVSVFAWVAEWERRRLVERTQAGLERARAQGIRLGRPAVSLGPHVLELELGKGGTPAQIAQRLGVGRSTFYRELARLRGQARQISRSVASMSRARKGRVAVPKRGTTQMSGNPAKSDSRRRRP